MSTLRVLLILAIVLGVGYVNAAVLLDAYGSGAPYYGRTTNMDKWENPLPWLVVGDLVALGICWGVWRLGRR